MAKARRLQPRFVEEVPSEISDGILYISKPFKTASHRCCCGCGARVVTPLNPAKWSLIEHEGSVSLTPSIGNWGLPCRSHYWIDKNRVRWSADMHRRQVLQVQARDARAVQVWAEEERVSSRASQLTAASPANVPVAKWKSPMYRLVAWLNYWRRGSN